MRPIHTIKWAVSPRYMSLETLAGPCDEHNIKTKTITATCHPSHSARPMIAPTPRPRALPPGSPATDKSGRSSSGRARTPRGVIERAHGRHRSPSGDLISAGAAPACIASLRQDECRAELAASRPMRVSIAYPTPHPGARPRAEQATGQTESRLTTSGRPSKCRHHLPLSQEPRRHACG